MVCMLMVSGDAQSNPYPCQGLSGERIVGMHPGNRAQAPIPMCVRDAVPSGAARPAAPMQQQWYDNYAAVVVSDFTTDVFAVWGKSSFDIARDAAIKRCQAFIERQDGCYYWMGVRNGAVAIAMRDDGELVGETGNDRDAANRAAMQKCTQNGRQCVMTRTFSAPSRLYRPTHEESYSPTRGPNTARLWASAAWPDQALQSPAIWLSTGHATLEEARAAVVSKCASDTGLVCKPRTKVADTHLAVFRDGNELVTSAALTLEHANVVMAAGCRAGASNCSLIHVAPARIQDTRKIGLN